MHLDFINRANADYVDGLYQEYLRDPESVDPQWALFFAGFEAGRGSTPTGNGAGASTALAAHPALGRSIPAMARINDVFPAPFDPMTVIRLLRGTSNVTPFNARA